MFHRCLSMLFGFARAVMANVTKNSKTRKNLEASYIVLWKPDLNEQNDFERIVFLEMVSRRDLMA